MRTDAAPTTHLLYLHGFRSSPQSTKARLVAARVAQQHPQVHWWCPALPPSPAEAMALVLDGLRDWPLAHTAICGSSLGGFYARWLQLAWGGRAVLLNPAVFPARDLAGHIGELPQWHQPEQRLFFQASHVEELRQMEADVAARATQAPPTPDRLMAVVAQGDEVLDWREMAAFCAGGHVRLLPGSDHAISDFPQHMDAVFAFLRLPSGSPG